MTVKVTLLLLVLFALLSTGTFLYAQETSLPGIPPNVSMGEIFTNLIDTVKQIFLQLGTVLGDIFGWIYNFWQLHILPWLQNAWNSIVRFFATFFEEKMPAVKEEFQREAKELTEEVPRLIKNLWQWLKGLAGQQFEEGTDDNMTSFLFDRNRV